MATLKSLVYLTKALKSAVARENNGINSLKAPSPKLTSIRRFWPLLGRIKLMLSRDKNGAMLFLRSSLDLRRSRKSDTSQPWLRKKTGLEHKWSTPSLMNLRPVVKLNWLPRSSQSWRPPVSLSTLKPIRLLLLCLRPVKWMNPARRSCNMFQLPYNNISQKLVIRLHSRQFWAPLFFQHLKWWRNSNRMMKRPMQTMKGKKRTRKKVKAKERRNDLLL